MMDERGYTWIEYDGDGEVVERNSYVVEIDPMEDAEAALLAAGASRTGAVPVPDNTKEWWVFFVCRVPSPRHQWPLGLKWVKEVAEPWRSGGGVAVRGLRTTLIVGCWRRGPAPDAHVEVVSFAAANTAPQDLVIR